MLTSIFDKKWINVEIKFEFLKSLPNTVHPYQILEYKTKPNNSLPSVIIYSTEDTLLTNIQQTLVTKIVHN